MPTPYTVVVPDREFYNEETAEFFHIAGGTFQIKHSLVSIAKWESKWNIPFLKDDNKTREQTLDYIRCMTLTQNVRSELYMAIPPEVIKEITAYIDAKMTATWFSKEENRKGKGGAGDTITAEIIYYWMIVHRIPMACEKWHLNRLLTLIRVCNAKSAPNKKRSHQEMMAERRRINEERKAKLGTKG